VVSTQLIDLVAARLGRGLCEVPIGFKWFYAESFQGAKHLRLILLEAQATGDAELALPSTTTTPSLTTSEAPP